MICRDPRNECLQVTKPVVPASVARRGTTEEALTLSEVVKCFDLSELVRDCHYPVQGQPAAETPKRLADNGLVLRDYQKSSLQWLLDKERNVSGMGSAGELWSRMRGLGAGGEASYFYCELTGSFVKQIFDYNSDVKQKDASRLGGDTFPSSEILGSEMVSPPAGSLGPSVSSSPRAHAVGPFHRSGARENRDCAVAGCGIAAVFAE